MGLLEEIGTHLDTSSTRFSLGTSLFLGILPDASTIAGTAGAVIETGGSPPMHTFASTRPVWEVATVQVLCRSTSPVTARANMDDAWTILDRVANQTLSGSTYLRITALQSPFLAWRDERERTVYGANFECWRRR